MRPGAQCEPLYMLCNMLLWGRESRLRVGVCAYGGSLRYPRARSSGAALACVL